MKLSFTEEDCKIIIDSLEDLKNRCHYWEKFWYEEFNLVQRKKSLQKARKIDSLMDKIKDMSGLRNAMY